MNEFSLINTFFKETTPLTRGDVIYGIGDDAACVNVPPGCHLLISTDTLLPDVHFISSWDPFDIAWRAVMVNVSDMAAMAAAPAWASLALTLPDYNTLWLTRFSSGLQAALKQFNITLIGGNTARGPLNITLTIHGFAPVNKAIRRTGAKTGDTLWVSGNLGAAALALTFLKKKSIPLKDQAVALEKLMHPNPRIDLAPVLQAYASAAIDISDGLSADLDHLCEASNVGACVNLNKLPIHSLVKKHQGEKASQFVLSCGDDYELCFTISSHHTEEFIKVLKSRQLTCYPIGIIEQQKGLRAITPTGEKIILQPKGYTHF